MNTHNHSHDLARSSNIRQAWLYFCYFWVIFAVGAYFGQFVPPALRFAVTIGIFALIMISLFVRTNRKFGFLISNILAFAMGIISYTSFMYYLSVLGTTAFYQNVGLAVVSFFAFGLIGYFVVGDATNLGRMLFPALIALVLASFVGIFIQIPMFHLVITIAGLAIFYLYTIFDFNRMKRGNFSPQEMGFNLFINLLNIIMDILRLASILKD